LRGCLVMTAKFHVQYSRQAACQFGMNGAFVIRFPAACGVDQDRPRGGLITFLGKAHFYAPATGSLSQPMIPCAGPLAYRPRPGPCPMLMGACWRACLFRDF